MKSKTSSVITKSVLPRFSIFFSKIAFAVSNSGGSIPKDRPDLKRLINLSQLERDLTSPSVATLENILEALGTNLKDFFSEDEDEQIVFSKDDFFENIQDDYKISYIIPNAQKNEMEPILIELKKGKNSMEIDPHDGEEFGYVIHGKRAMAGM